MENIAGSKYGAHQASPYLIHCQTHIALSLLAIPHARVLQPGGKYKTCGCGILHGVCLASWHLSSVCRMMVRCCDRPQASFRLIICSSKQASADDPFEELLKSKKKVNSVGPLSQLKEIKGAILCHSFELHEQGIHVNMFMIVLKASMFLLNFCSKSFTAWCSTVKHFVKALSMVFKWECTRCSDPPQKLRVR